MTDLKAKFDERFKAQFPATYEASLRGEPKPHGDFSNAWWGFREGYRCALPTTEPAAPKQTTNWTEGLKRLAMFLSVLIVGGLLGYKYPRDLELESTKPVEIRYEVTSEAARYLVLKAVKGIDPE